MKRTMYSWRIILFLTLSALILTVCRLPGGSEESVSVASTGTTTDDMTSYLPIVETAWEQDDPASTRLQPADLVYQGAFALPDDFGYGAEGISYYPEGDAGSGALFVTGHVNQPAVFAVADLPAPVIEDNWEALPMANMLTDMNSFDGNLIEEQLDSGTTYAGGIEYVPAAGDQTGDKLYGSADWWYAVTGESFPTVWMAELDGSDPRGLFHVGPWEFPYHGNRIGDYLFTLPDWYADQYLGGRNLVSGKSRGAFGGSMGPTLFAFRPWEVENPGGDLDAVPMLWYRELYPECAGPNLGDKSKCDYPDFTMCDEWTGGAFVEVGESRAVLIYGVKGLGGNDYGAPSSPDACSMYQGYHCDPFERQVTFYDIDELAAVASGARDAWTVVPYAIWRPDELLLGDENGHTCGGTGGMAVDAAGQRLFVVEKGFGGNNGAVVHVWGWGG